MKVRGKWIKFKDTRDTECPCYSCAKVDSCKAKPHIKSHNQKTGWDFKKKIHYMVVSCSGWKEQVFDMPSEEVIDRMYGVVYDMCYEICANQPNITQSNDGWDSMIEELTYGIVGSIRYRKKHNELERRGERFINENS